MAEMTPSQTSGVTDQELFEKTYAYNTPVLLTGTCTGGLGVSTDEMIEQQLRLQISKVSRSKIIVQGG